jgi:glutathione S-transferase
MPHYKLIGLPASRAARNLWMLEELGVPYENDPIHYTDPALKKPPYIDWNPNGSIPFLLIDGKPMFESLAINLYLAGKHQGPLSGTSAEEGGLCAQWTLWAATALEPDIGQFAYHTMFLPEPERVPALAAAAVEKLKKPFGILNTLLAKQPYLLGSAFTVADLNVAAVGFRALSTPIIGDYPHLKAWVEKCWARPAAVKVRRMRGEKV